MVKKPTVGTAPEDGSVVPSEPIEPGQPGEPTTPSVIPDVSELVQTINALVALVQNGQARDEETRQKMAEMETKHAADMAGMMEVVESTGDKSRVTTYQMRTAKKQPSQFGICIYNGKIVMSWGKMKSNLVYKNELKATIENLVSTLFYEDGTSEDVPYQKWQLERVMLPAQFAGKEVKLDEETGDEINLYKLVVLPSEVATTYKVAVGKALSINVIFLN